MSTVTLRPIVQFGPSDERDRPFMLGVDPDGQIVIVAASMELVAEEAVYLSIALLSLAGASFELFLELLEKTTREVKGMHADTGLRPIIKYGSGNKSVMVAQGSDGHVLVMEAPKILTRVEAVYLASTIAALSCVPKKDFEEAFGWFEKSRVASMAGSA